MEKRNWDPEYEEAVKTAIDGVICPACGQPAHYMPVTWKMGQFWVMPVFACDTEGCEFNGATGEATWTLASSD